MRYNGQRAVRVDVYRTSGEQVLDIVAAIKNYLAADVVPSLPEGVSVELWKDDAEQVSGRLGLMIKNALLGLLLVFGALALFLEIRLAMWVAVGLAVSFLGTFLVMGFLNISINMFSMMALVLALGIVVDDAIVVGESVFAERERDARGLEAAIDGAFDVRSNLDDGFRELQLELKPRARSLNLTLDHFAARVRSVFFGAEALRVPRGREDMRVYVRLPEEERNSATDVERYLVRTPGDEVPLGQVASAGFARSSAAIHRVDGRRAVTVTADVDPRSATSQQVNASLESDVLAQLTARNPGLVYTYGGQRKDQEEAIAVLGRSLVLALLIMYGLMAIPFGSYSQLLIIMTAVPLGAIGALAGHMLLGLSWGLWSLYGLIGVLFATLLLMLVVPALVMSQYNLADWRESRRLGCA